MSTFAVTVRMEGEIPVVLPQGYYSGESGDEVHSVVDQLFREGRTSFLFDFSGCDIVNSPGVVSLMDLTVKIVEDYRGRVVMIGLDDLKKTVFKMAGVMQYAGVADGLVNGLKSLQAQKEK